METGTEMPSLEGATEWFNATGASAEARADGHPTLVHFWSASCDACRENFARIAEWRDTYAAGGLRVVAVHLPRNEEDADSETVREAVMTCRMTEPCAVDNQRVLGRAFQQTETDLPAYYLFDREGKLSIYAAGADALSDVARALEGFFGSAASRTEQ